MVCFEHLNGELYATFLAEAGVYVMKVLSSITGEALRNFVSGLRTCYGLTSDENGSLWITGYEESMVIQVDPTEENSHFMAPPYLRRYYTPDFPGLPRGIAYDGTHLWIIVQNSIYQCDSGVGIPKAEEGFPFHVFWPVVVILGFTGFSSVLVYWLRKK